jgi:hypothetical protein
MERWNGKHPLPWDFFNTFSNVSGKNLNWFWNSWFFSPGYIDHAIQDVKKSSTGYSVIINNVGGFPAPADLLITYSDGTKETKHIGPSTWEKNPKQATITVVTKKKIEKVDLKGGIFMDSDEKDNTREPGQKPA